ncbi:MAG: bifunctional alpha,alpha-trehalose-phosphate synthase (UDP-forming)/trehalose-phosphatase [Bacteroidales bacterium]|nr:bifunctional alpha,alpha-trehalose-phosphate synthase (UDP-forming)/trehalose-phosphatase [Bacteroidales bacterium]
MKNRFFDKDNKIVWTGIANNLPGDFSLADFKNEHFNIVNVKLSPKLNDLFYGGFSNDLLWPLFHYFSSYSVFNNFYLEAYEEANNLFCEEIIKITKPGDYIWIHDYHLMLLPKMIREKIPDAVIGFFLHIPFPSFEIFRLLPRRWRNEIIDGMLGADLIGFHTHDYAQHFIKSVKRTTGYDCHQNIIYTTSNVVKADAFPIGIDYEKYHAACTSKTVLSEKQKTVNNLAGRKLIFSVDRLDYSKGLLLRLRGYETFLERYPEWRSKVVFNMVVVPSRDKIDKYREMKKEIESTVGRINGKYGSLVWMPIIYQYKSLSFNELIALYDTSDVGLITPLRDGMNLVAKEYVACQVENKGVLILSEMTGAAAELNEALIINPVDNVEMAEAINNALEMGTAEKETRIERMQNRIANYNVFTWAFDFFNRTYDTKKQQNLLNMKFINKDIYAQIASKYQHAKKRIIFLDYDGTLVSFHKYPEFANVDKDTINIIQRLSHDQRNHIVIISGRGVDFLDRQFQDIEINMVAEHGLYIKRSGKKWESTVKSDIRWKERVKPILMEYVNRCNGTFIEEKNGSLAWHYRNADMDFAQLRLNELKDELAEIIRYKTDLEILEGNKVLEVKSGKYDKGQAAKVFMTNEQYDFIMAAGDDKTDEFLFQALPESAFTIKVGLSPSYARYNVSDRTQLLQLLENLI